MAELIVAIVEALVAMLMGIIEAMPVVIETLIYVAAGASTIVAYALSRRFRERKQREWRERPKRKYMELGISAACISVLALVGLWIFLPRSKPMRSRDSLADSQQGGEFRLVIGDRSGQTSNQFTIEVKKETIAKLLHRKSHHNSGQTDSLAVVAAETDSGTNKFQPNVPANGSQSR